jgi:hypothetical protein
MNREERERLGVEFVDALQRPKVLTTALYATPEWDSCYAVTTFLGHLMGHGDLYWWAPKQVSRTHPNMEIRIQWGSDIYDYNTCLLPEAYGKVQAPGQHAKNVSFFAWYRIALRLARAANLYTGEFR